MHPQSVFLRRRVGTLGSRHADAMGLPALVMQSKEKR